MGSIIETAVSVTEAERKAAAKNYPGPTDFVHLHNHTLFSPLDGIATPDEYFKACAELGNPAFSITDHGSMASIPDAYLAASASKVKFIPGCEIYFSQGHQELMELRKDSNWKIGALKPDYSKDVFTVEDLDGENQYSKYRRNRHLSVLAKDMMGYRNLIRMTTEAWRIGFYYKPRIWFEQIEKYQEGLIVLSGCLNGPVCHHLRKSAFWRGVASGKIKSVERHLNKKRKIIVLNISKEEAKQRFESNFKEAVNWIMKFRDLLGDRFYLEMQMPGDEIPFGKEAFHQVAMLSENLEIPAVLTNDCLELDFPILMGDGTFKPIGETKIGEEVITHTGARKRIVAKEIRPRKPAEKMLKIKNIPWSMTDSHPLYYDNLDKDQSRAKLRLDHATLGRVKFGQGVKLIDTKMWVKPKRGTKLISDPTGKTTIFGSPREIWKTSSPVTKNIKIPRYLRLDDELLWVIGQYIAEGFRDKYRISFATHKAHKSIHSRIINYFKQFGLNPDYNEKRTNSKNGGVIRICSTIFADILSSWCGQLAHNKHLPPFWLQLSEDQFKVMLSGYIAGDGDTLIGKGGSKFHWASTSWQLTGQLQVAIASLGGYAKPWFKPEQLYESGRVDKCQYHGTSSQLSTAVIENREWPTHHKALDVYDPIKMVVPVDWENAEEIDLVCDIEVEDDHTFILWGNIISQNCHYLSRTDFKVQKCMMAIDQGLSVDDPNLFHVNSDEQFFKSRAQLRETFYKGGYDKLVTSAKFEEVCDNTVALAETCTSFSPDLTPKLPHIDNAEEKLHQLIIQGLKNKGLLDNSEKFVVDGQSVTYREQAQIEYQRYSEKGFASYFLIIKDLLDHSKSNNWDVGPGRGSAGGSLVCYLIGIHSIDPLAWGLSSVRFMGDSRGGKLLNVKMD